MASLIEPLIINQPLWKKIGLVVLSIAFVGIGVLIIKSGNYVLGAAEIGLFGLGGVVIAFAPRRVLIADAQGITLFARRSQTTIPWNIVDNIYVATQNLGATKQHFLAFRLTDPEYLIKNSVALQIGAAINQLVAQKTVDDGGTGHLYIPSSRLPHAPQKIADMLNAKHSSAGAAISQNTAVA